MIDRKYVDDLELALALKGIKVLGKCNYGGRMTFKLDKDGVDLPVMLADVPQGPFAPQAVEVQLAFAANMPEGSKWKEYKHVTGLTHLFEHCLFHNVRVMTDNGYVDMDSEKLFAYAQKHNIMLNAHTSCNGIYIDVMFNPPVVDEKKYENDLLSDYKFFKNVKVEDQTSVAYSLIEDIAFNHRIDIVSTEALSKINKEREVVKAEQERYMHNDHFWIGTRSRMTTHIHHEYAGTPEDIDKISDKDILTLDRAFRNNCQGGILKIDMEHLTIEEVVKNVEYLFDVLDRNTNNCKFDRRYEVKGVYRKYTEVYPPKHPKYDETRITHLDKGMQQSDLVIVRWPMIQYPTLKKNRERELHKGVAVSEMIVAGMDRPMTLKFREEYKRTYSVESMSTCPPSGDGHTYAQTGFFFQVTVTPEEKKKDGSWKKSTVERIEKEIRTAISGISITEEQFKDWTTATKLHVKSSLGEFNPLSMGSSLDYLMAGLINFKTVEENSKLECHDLTYQDALDYIEHIKETWKAVIYRKLDNE